jgi:ADP-ribose 1''-phosphate phosphatase
VITYVKDSLFNAPAGSILIHSCNCRGVWGSGIAKQFAERFPAEKNYYTEECKKYGKSLLGSCLFIPAGDYTIACLFTSDGYGMEVDSVDSILDHTKSAIEQLIYQAKKQPMHMCKINSGLFQVPWEKTVAILEDSGQFYTVYEL